MIPAIKKNYYFVKFSFEFHVPVIEIVKELVEIRPLLEAGLPRDQLVVAAVEFFVEPAKHSGYGQVEFRVSVK